MELGRIERPTIGRFIDVEFFRIIRFLPMEMLGERIDGLIYTGAKDAATDMEVDSIDEIVTFFREKGVGRLTILSTDPLEARLTNALPVQGFLVLGGRCATLRAAY